MDRPQWAVLHSEAYGYGGQDLVVFLMSRADLKIYFTLDGGWVRLYQPWPQHGVPPMSQIFETFLSGTPHGRYRSASDPGESPRCLILERGA